jgi:hemerythrin-like domain-containing protein
MMRAMAAPLTLHAAPAAGFDQPFEMLEACHERVRRMLALLGRLRAHLAEHGADAPAREAARDVMRYFDLAAPLHHADEELHVFPVLAASGDAGLAGLAGRLAADHRRMAGDWAVVRADLAAVAQGQALAPAHVARWLAFVELYERHAVEEDGIAYPAARERLAPAALALMGEDMAARRGLRPAAVLTGA